MSDPGNPKPLSRPELAEMLRVGAYASGARDALSAVKGMLDALAGDIRGRVVVDFLRGQVEQLEERLCGPVVERMSPLESLAAIQAQKPKA